MTKSCRKSILCQPRRGKCCLGVAIFVVLHFRHIRIALSSAEAMRGVSTNSRRLSPNQALHLSSMKAKHQTHRCRAVSFSSPQNLTSAGSCLLTSAHQLPRAVWWPHMKRERFTLSFFFFFGHSPLAAVGPPPLDPTPCRTGGGASPCSSQSTPSRKTDN